MPTRYDEYVKAPFQDVEFSPDDIRALSKCKNDIYEFSKYAKVVHPDEGRVTFVPRDYQREILDMVKDNRLNIILASRQCGKSTTIGVYVMWYACFNKDKRIGIVSNKEASAKDILSRIKLIYEELPFWLKPGGVKYNETSIEFDNGTTIKASATSKDAFRGRTLNLLIMDEFAFVPPGQANEFWSSNYPTISESKTAKVIIISTPNGMHNLFHQLYTKAENKKNSFAYLKISWQRVPGRDAKWAETQKKVFGKKRFAQEYAVEFLGSANTVIDSDVLEILTSKDYPDPVHLDLNGNFRIYEKPQQEAQYTLGVDTAKGTGEHYSVVQVLKVLSVAPAKVDQVAVFESNTTDVYTFSGIVNRISYYYNGANIMVENNAEGNTVVSELWWNYENSNLINEGTKKASLGIRATNKTKPRAVLLMKKFIEDYHLILRDNRTIQQLTAFIDKGNNRFSGNNMDDDLISALYWATYIFTFDVFDSSVELVSKQDEFADGWGILADVDIQEDWSWLTS